MTRIVPSQGDAIFGPVAPVVVAAVSGDGSVNGLDTSLVAPVGDDSTNAGPGPDTMDDTQTDNTPPVVDDPPPPADDPSPDDDDDSQTDPDPMSPQLGNDQEYTDAALVLAISTFA